MYKLPAREYGAVSALFEGLEFQLITAAVLDGASPGRVWVDDVRQPRTAFMASPEGCFLTGNAGNEATNQALNELIVGNLLHRYDAIVVVPQPDGWERNIEGVLKGCRAIQEERRHYRLDRLRLDWRAALPPGFAVERIDADLLSRPGLAIPDHITDWMVSNWESVDGFLRNGFGFCTVHGDRIVSWSLADCIVGDACEIGIHTTEDHRRQGLGALTAAAAADHALSHGLSEIGWHCHESNYGSRGVAEKVGFVHDRDYVHYLCLAPDRSGE